MQNTPFDPPLALVQALRAQRHDFMNHLQVIWGYLQVNKADRALTYAENLAVALQQHADIGRLSDPGLIALLLSAQSYAARLQIPLGVRLPVPVSQVPIFPADIHNCVYSVITHLFEWLEQNPNPEQCITIEIDSRESNYTIGFTGLGAILSECSSLYKCSDCSVSYLQDGVRWTCEITVPLQD